MAKIDYEARLQSDRLTHPMFRRADGGISLADISDRYNPKCVHGNYLVDGVTCEPRAASCGCTLQFL